MNWNLRNAGIAALAATLPFTTASGVLAAPAPQADNLDSLGSAESNDMLSNGLTVEAHVAERNESGNLLAITWSVENYGNQDVMFTWLSGDTYMYNNSNSYSGVTVTSSTGERRYHPIMDKDGTCLCSGGISFDEKFSINQGDKVAYWSMFSVPEDVESIDLEIPGFDPIEGIPIS